MSDSDSTAGTMALYAVRGDGGGPPSLASAADQLGVSLDDLDRAFGVVSIDPQAGLYAVQARSDRVSKSADGERRYRGPYSVPKIVPFDPGRSEEEGD